MSAESGDRARVLSRIADHLVGLEGTHPIRVAIDGLSGAGKSTLADELASIVESRGRSVIRASIDDFHRPRADRYQMGRLSPEGYYRFAFDYPAFRASLLLPLGPGGDRRYRLAIFDQRHDTPVETPECEASPDAILLVDGVFLLRPELDDLWDFRIFVDADVNVAIERAIRRDMTVATSLERVRETYRRRYVPGERIYLETVRPMAKADLILGNTDVEHPCPRGVRST